MAHVLTVELKKYELANYGGRAPAAPDAQPPNTATLWVDWDNYKWQARANKAGFLSVFGVSQGTITTTHGFFVGNSDQILAYPSGTDLIQLQNYGLNPQAKLKGIGFFGANPNAKGSAMSGVANPFLYFTYFWRKMSGREMTRTERIEEMYYIATTKYSNLIGGEAIQQLKGLATAESLASMGAILVVFAVATSLGWGLLLGALRAFCGIMDIATNRAMYQPYWDAFCQEVNTGNNLDNGAEALATCLGAALGYVSTNAVSGKVSEAAGKKIQQHANKFVEAARNNSPQQWKAVAEKNKVELQQKARDSGDPNNTKIDPAKDVTPADRERIAAEHPEMIKTIRETAIKFGFSPDIAAGYAMMAYRNGWSIFIRTSKPSSLPLHERGPADVTSKSLFVKYKIDEVGGVIIKEAGMHIESDFYATNSYAAKQLEAIFYAEHPNAPKGSFQITKELMTKFRQDHVFEFRKQKWGKHEVEILYHNGKMVIGDMDLMGIYVKTPQGVLVPLPQWMIHNDAKFTQEFVNRNAGGIPMNKHGQQDVGRNQKGQPFRAPDADERFAYFTPDLKLKEVKSAAALQTLYSKLRVMWPYENYVQMQGLITHWAVDALLPGLSAGNVGKTNQKHDHTKPKPMFVPASNMPRRSYPIAGKH